MLWLPLVAMVIASALPFPHSPASGFAATATTTTTTTTAQPAGSHSSRKHRRDPDAHLAAPPAGFGGNASQTDFTAAADRRTAVHGRRGDYVKETSTFRVENQIHYQPLGSSGGHDKSGASVDVPGVDVPGVDVPGVDGTLRTEDFSADNSLPKDYPGVSGQRDPRDSTDAPPRASTEENHDVVSPATMLKGQKGPDPTAPSLRASPTARTGGQQTPDPGAGPSEESLAAEAGPDSFLGWDRMFLDAHPRVLFSPSPSPPEHPPLLLMLETDLLDEGGDREEQGDADGLIEGHGDRAIDRSGANHSGAAAGEAARPARRDKRSHVTDSRRGERSVCESQSGWVSDKKTAIDIDRKNVTVLQEIQTQTGPLKQYFYETRCRQVEWQSGAGRTRGVTVRSTGLGVAGARCLGVDTKQWNSECKVKHSYVRALTKDANNRIKWRWIRIDSSCVCVLLSRTNQGRDAFKRTGRG